jgi:membrane-associated phospholipid phosphatase
VGTWRGLAAISSWWVINGLLVGLLVALLVLRRFRHLIVVLVLAQLLTLVVQAWLPPIAQRPRPFGVAIGAGWGGWGMPSLQVTLFAALLVAILYSMVPEGRWRNTGKWIAAGLVTLTGLGRVALGADAPTDVLVAAAIGVTLPLVAFRLFAPNEIFPVAYRQGRARPPSQPHHPHGYLLRLRSRPSRPRPLEVLTSTAAPAGRRGQPHFTEVIDLRVPAR